MAEATVHPNHQLISSEDVEGTSVYSPGREEIGSIDHLMIDKRSGKISYAVMSFRRVPRPRTQPLSYPMVSLAL